MSLRSSPLWHALTNPLQYLMLLSLECIYCLGPHWFCEWWYLGHQQWIGRNRNLYCLSLNKLLSRCPIFSICLQAVCCHYMIWTILISLLNKNSFNRESWNEKENVKMEPDKIRDISLREARMFSKQYESYSMLYLWSNLWSNSKHPLNIINTIRYENQKTHSK